MYTFGESDDLLHTIPGVVSHGNNMNINQLNISIYSQHQSLIYLFITPLHSVPATKIDITSNTDNQSQHYSLHFLVGLFSSAGRVIETMVIQSIDYGLCYTQAWSNLEYCASLYLVSW